MTDDLTADPAASCRIASQVNAVFGVPGAPWPGTLAGMDEGSDPVQSDG